MKNLLSTFIFKSVEMGGDYYVKNENVDYIGQTISTVKETGYSHASVESFITQDGPRWAEKAHTLQKNHN